MKCNWRANLSWPACAIIILLVSDLQSQSAPGVEKHNNDFLYALGAPAGYLNRQADNVLTAAQSILKAYPPKQRESPERRLALFAIDAVLYDDIYSPQRLAVQDFYHSRMQIARQCIIKTHVQQGALICKLYNHGFVVKTKSCTMGFDMVRGECAGADGFAVSERDMADIIAECDVVFISHHHADHVDEWIVRRCISIGKPVIVPPDLWAGKPIRDSLLILQPSPDALYSVPIQSGKAKLKLRVWPGHQNQETSNNIYLVTTCEGITICHTGDQHNRDDIPWISRFAGFLSVDVVLVNCWARDIIELIGGIRPQWVVTGHEHELGHGTNQRKPYWLTFQRLARCPVPFFVMAWGESIIYIPQPG